MFILTKFIVILAVFCITSFAAPHQELLPKPGYVPVYIREGNTPLNQINLKLAEAFNEDDDFIQSQAIENIENERNGTSVEDKKINANQVHNKEQENSFKTTEKQEQKVPVSDAADITVGIKKFTL